jgi:hypothetical protein
LVTQYLSGSQQYTYHRQVPIMILFSKYNILKS